MSNVISMSVVSLSLSIGMRSEGSLALDTAAVLHGEMFRLVASHLYFKRYTVMYNGAHDCSSALIYDTFLYVSIAAGRSFLWAWQSLDCCLLLNDW